MKLLYILVLIIFIPGLLLSGDATIDSLKNQLDLLEDEEQVELMIDIAKALLYSSPHESIDFANQAYTLSQQIDYLQGEIQALKLLGAGNHLLSRYDKALKFYDKLIDKLEQTDDKKEIATTLNRIGIVHEECAEYNMALNSYFAALNIYEEIDYKKGVGLTLNNIGLVYWNFGTYNQALEYYQKALSLFEELGNKQHIAHVLNNIGIAYKSLDDQNKALEYYLRSLKLKEELGDVKGIASSLGNIAIIYKNLNKYDEALQYYSRVLDITRQSEDKWGTANTLNNIGNLFLKQGNFSTAQNYLEQGLELGKEIHAKSNVSNSYFFLSELYSAKHDYKKSLECYKRYAEINDSIFTEESTDKILELQTKYETEKKENENQLLKVNLEIAQFQKDRLTYFLIGAFALLAFIIFYTISRIKINRHLNLVNKDLKIAKENAEQVREQIALVNKILRHDLTNSLSVIKAAIDMYQNNGEDEMLDEIQGRCKTSIDLIKQMRMLEIGSKDANELKSVDVRKLLEKIAGDLNDADITIRGNSKVLADEALESVFLNLIDNARRHGDATSFTVKIDESHEFSTISITNNGRKIDTNIEKEIFNEGVTTGDEEHTGMGLFLVRQNITRYGGSILLAENREYHVTFVINLPQAKNSIHK